MEFLDNLILGKNTPAYSDEAMFPSKTYKKNICRKKHCTSLCSVDSQGGWEYWAVFLSESKVKKVDVQKNIVKLKSILRYSVWLKLTNSKKEDQKISTNSSNIDRDKYIIHVVFRKFRNKDIEEEKIFNIVRSLCDSYPDINDYEIFIDFIYFVLDLPLSNVDYLHNLMFVLLGKHKLYRLFSYYDNEDDKRKEIESLSKEIEIVKKEIDSSEGKNSGSDEIKDEQVTEPKTPNKKNLENSEVKCDESTNDCKDSKEENSSKKEAEPENEYKKIEKEIPESVKREFTKKLVNERFSDFCKLIDFFLCYDSSDFEMLIGFISQKTDSKDPQIWIEYISVLHNLEVIMKYFNSIPYEEDKILEEKKGETYFDFLVIQNETIKAQENIKQEYIGKISELEEENRDLKQKNDHLIELSQHLEEELKDYQDGYVSGIKKMLEESKRKNDELEKEILQLKEEIIKIKKENRKN